MSTLVLWGCGAVGVAILELLGISKIIMPMHWKKVVIIEPRAERHKIAKDICNRWKIQFNGIQDRITPENVDKLMSVIADISIIIDITCDTETIKLLEWIAKSGYNYINTSIESPGEPILYKDKEDFLDDTTNYQHTKIRKMASRKTIALECGMNPGLISHFTKVGLKILGNRLLKPAERSNLLSPNGYAKLAWKLGVHSVLCTERDTQLFNRNRHRGEFINTWSAYGYISEGMEAAQVGNTSYKIKLPCNAPKVYMASNSTLASNDIVLFRKRGFENRTRSLVSTGAITGYLIPHGETETLAKFLTYRPPGKSEVHRPTTYYVYESSSATEEAVRELIARNYKLPDECTVIEAPNIVSGMDEVGTLMLTTNGCNYWFGTILDIIETKKMGFKYAGPTSVQVAVGLLTAWRWILAHPNEGIVFPEAMDSDLILKWGKPYLGKIVFKQLCPP
jgi:homospermidine synthase